MTLLLLVIALLFYFGCDIYDVRMTEKGIKAGVAIEGNTFLLGTDKPTALAEYLRDTVELLIAVGPAIVFLALRKPELKPLFYGALAGPVALGGKHILGGLAWKKLLEGQKPTPSEQA